MRALERLAIDEVVRPLGFSEVVEPMHVSLDTWLTTGHLEGMPQEMYYTCEPATRDTDAWERFVDLVKITHEIPDEELQRNLKNVRAGVCYAQCPNIYAAMAGKTVADSSLPVLLFDRSVPSNRYESGGRHGIERVDEFHRIEILYIGTREQLLEIREKLMERYRHVFNEILDLEWRMARVTPFYLQQAGIHGEASQDQGTIDFFSEQIEKEYNQFFFVDSVLSESFFNKEVDPYTRVMRENQYELYIIDEVLPYINDENSNPFVIAAGAELGAYQSLRLALKNPELFDKVISISGYYDINLFLDGFKDDNSYYNNPIEFIPNLNDETILKSISSLDLRLISYLNDPNRIETLRMSDILWMKFLQHDITVWKEESSKPWSLYPIMLRENLI